MRRLRGLSHCMCGPLLFACLPTNPTPPALQSVSGLVRPGQLACLMGASGAGKTVRALGC